MKASIATVTLTGFAPLSQSRKYDDDVPALEGEQKGDYDARTWRNHLHVEEREGRRTVVLPAHGIMQAVTAAARYSSKQIQGQGKKTWTAKFAAGIMLLENPSLNLDPDTVPGITISADSNGKRGSGSRVPRRFPQIPQWQTTFDVWILDPIITKDIFREMVELAGMFVGIGRFRPANGGTNGRFKLTDLQWQDNRQLVA